MLKTITTSLNSSEQLLDQIQIVGRVSVMIFIRHVFKYGIWFLMKKQVLDVYQKIIFALWKRQRKKADLKNKTMNHGNFRTMKLHMP